MRKISTVAKLGHTVSKRNRAAVAPRSTSTLTIAWAMYTSNKIWPIPCRTVARLSPPSGILVPP